jgi:hypothetical protein
MEDNRIVYKHTMGQRLYSTINMIRKTTIKILQKTVRFEVLTTARAEDGNRMFLRNVGIYQRVYKAPKPRTSPPPLVSSPYFLI